MPAFMKIFKNFGVDLPGPTLLMISSFESLSQFGWLLLPIAAIVCFLLVRAAPLHQRVLRLSVGLGPRRHRHHLALARGRRETRPSDYRDAAIAGRVLPPA